MSEKQPSHTEPEISQPDHFRVDNRKRKLNLDRFNYLVSECIKPPRKTDNRLFYVQTDEWLYMFQADGTDFQGIIQVLKSISSDVIFYSFGQVTYRTAIDGQVEPGVTVEGSEARSVSYWANKKTSDTYREIIMSNRFTTDFIVK